MKTYGTCDTYYFSQLTKKEDYYFAATTDDYATIFKQIADKIIESMSNEKETVKAEKQKTYTK